MTKPEKQPDSQHDADDLRGSEEPARSERSGRDRPTRTLLGGAYDSVRQLGRDVISVALGRLTEEEEAERDAESERESDDQEASAERRPRERVNMLHSVAEQLRGAADNYLAAKLDEIEARVDEKLDAIEGRIDRKIDELNEQLAEMRDRELRHRLRLLKFTLIFTVVVALLSLVYKWIEIHWLATSA